MDKQSLILIAMELDLPSVLNFCKSSKKINNSVCKNKFFWINKLKKDYNFDFTKTKRNAKEYYKILYKSNENPNIGLESSVSLGYDDLVEYFLNKNLISLDTLNYVIKNTNNIDILDMLIPKLIDSDPYFNRFNLEEILKGKKNLFNRYKKYLIRKYFKNLIDAIDEDNERKIQNIVDNDLYDFEIYLDYDKENILNFIKDNYREYF